MVAFLIDFRSFRYIICYFWWLVQEVLLLKAIGVFFCPSLIRRAVFGQRSESGLWFFIFLWSMGLRMAWFLCGCIPYWIPIILVYYMLFLVACAGSFGFKSKRSIFLAIPDPTCHFWPAFRIRTMVFYIFCELWILEWYDSYVVAFLNEFQSFWYIICYFWWLV